MKDIRKGLTSPTTPLYHIFGSGELKATFGEMLDPAAFEERMFAEEGGLASILGASHDDQPLVLIEGKYKTPARAYLRREDERHGTSSLTMAVSSFGTRIGDLI